MTSKLIKNGTLVNPHGYIENDLLIEKEYIKEIGGKLKKKNIEIIDATGCYVTAGLIDIHIHGGAGCNFLDCSKEKFSIFKKDLIKHGTTAIVPTIMSASMKRMVSNLDYLSDFMEEQNKYQPKFLGINLEGPFLSDKYKGIHAEEDLQTLTRAKLNKLLNDKVKIITLAPELDLNRDIIPYLVSKKILVAMGHSSASYEEAQKATNQGVSLVTHLFNAMSPFHHRNPGIISAALTEDSLYIEIIADGIHVHPAAIKLALKTKSKDKIILVSDSIALRDSPDMKYYVGDEKIEIIENKAIDSRGILSGSILPLDQSVRNLVNWGLVDFKTAINFVTFNPANFLGIKEERGCLMPGCFADIVLWDKNTLNIKATIISGKYYSTEALESSG